MSWLSPARRSISKKNRMFLGYVFVLLPTLLFGYNNCGKTSANKGNNILLGNGSSCASLTKYIIPLEVSHIDDDFEEENNMNVREVISSSSCANAVIGEQATTFAGSVKRDLGVLYVLTNLKKRNGNPYVLRFENNVGEIIPQKIDRFCISDTNMMVISASGTYNTFHQEMIIQITSNSLPVTACGKANP